jgi:hypothetical protein
MAAFAILAPLDNQVLPGIIQTRFPKHYFIGPGQWVVAETGATAQQVAERIGATGSSGLFVVFSIAGHFSYFLFGAARRMGLEGLVSKRADRPYRGGRSKDWIKVKNRGHHAFERVRESFTQR